MPGFKGVAQIQKKTNEAVLHCQLERWSDVAALQSTKGNTEGSVFLFDMPLVKFNKRVLQGSFYLNLLLRYIS